MNPPPEFGALPLQLSSAQAKRLFSTRVSADILPRDLNTSRPPHVGQIKQIFGKTRIGFISSSQGTVHIKINASGIAQIYGFLLHMQTLVWFGFIGV